MKIKIRTLEGSIFEVEESVIEAYKVPKEIVEQQLKQLDDSLRLNMEDELKEEKPRSAPKTKKVRNSTSNTQKLQTNNR